MNIYPYSFDWLLGLFLLPAISSIPVLLLPKSISEFAGDWLDVASKWGWWKTGPVVWLGFVSFRSRAANSKPPAAMPWFIQFSSWRTAWSSTVLRQIWVSLLLVSSIRHLHCLKKRLVDSMMPQPWAHHHETRKNMRLCSPSISGFLICALQTCTAPCAEALCLTPALGAGVSDRHVALLVCYYYYLTDWLIPPVSAPD